MGAGAGPSGGSRRVAGGGASGGSPLQDGRSSRRARVTARESTGARERSRRRVSAVDGCSQSTSSAGFGGSGRWAARIRCPAAASAAPTSIATKIPHCTPTVPDATSGLSNSRQISRNTTQPPAIVIAQPSPPGRWKPRSCERA